MELLGLLPASVAPALAILAYAVVKARADWRSEAIWTAFLLGGVAALGVVLVVMAFGLGLTAAFPGIGSGAGAGPGGAAFFAFGVAAVPEELAKFVLLVSMAERHVDVRRRQDLVPLAVAVALGFAALENVLYVLAAESWHSTAAIRALTAVPLHGALGLIMGAMLTFARLRPGRRRRWLAAALAFPIAAHGLYDLPLMLPGVPPDGAWPFLPWTAVLVATGLLATESSTSVLREAAGIERAAQPVTTTPGERLAALTVGLSLLVVLPGLAGVAALAAGYPWFVVLDRVPIALLPAILGRDLLRWPQAAAPP